MRNGTRIERRGQWRHTFGVLVVVFAWVGSLASCSGCEGRPNVLLVSIDTLRADHLAAYGYERETAPSLTRLAGEGVRFENSYSQSSSTVPTHASLFTGRFPFQHGAYEMGLAVGDGEHTLAERFRDAGYRTFAATSSVRFRGKTGFDQGFDVFERFDHLDKNDRSEAVTNRVREWIAGDKEPWFVFVHYFDPHQPYAPPEPWRTQWHPGIPTLAPEATSQYVHFHKGPDRSVPANVLAYLRGLYDGEIRYLDVQLERLFASLAPTPGTPGTLVVVTSDHGEEFKEHGGLSHTRQLHEELVRVPLLAWWPGRIPAGTVVARPVQTVDLLPTLLDLAGVELTGAVSGRSRAAEMRGEDADLPPDSAATDLVLAQLKASRWALTADVGESRFKYVFRDDAPHRLFDLVVDPEEREDLIHTRPEVVSQLRELGAALGVDAPPVVPAPVPAPVAEDIRERLREIGYVEEAGGAQEPGRR